MKKKSFQKALLTYTILSLAMYFIIILVVIWSITDGEFMFFISGLVSILMTILSSFGFTHGYNQAIADMNN